MSSKKRSKSQTTLVIDRNWLPIRVIGAKVAVRLLFQGRYRAVDRNFMVIEKEDWLKKENIERLVRENYPCLQSIHGSFPIPTILMTTTTVKQKAFRSVSLKRLVYLQKHQCPICGFTFPTESFTKEHVIPRSKGGDNCSSNILATCFDCNNLKKDTFPYICHDGIDLREKVKRFSPLNLLKSSIKVVPSEWKPLLFKETLEKS